MLILPFRLTTRVPVSTAFSVVKNPYRPASISSAIRRGSRKSAVAGERRGATSRSLNRVGNRQGERSELLIGDGYKPGRSGFGVTARTSKFPIKTYDRSNRPSLPGRRALERHESRSSYGGGRRQSNREWVGERDNGTSERSAAKSGGSKPTRSESIAKKASGQYREDEGREEWPPRENPLRKKDYDETPDPARKGRHQYDPISIPFTTSASEFLYGTSVVKAALKARRRLLYTLYVYAGEHRIDVAQDRELRSLADTVGVKVRQVRGDWLRVMDKMSKGRPHNGYVLEASPLPQLPVRSLNLVDARSSVIEVDLDYQSREEEEINQSSPVIRCQTSSRSPVILLLDGVLDPGNIGAILRTAFFFGIDAVAVVKSNNAPIGPIAQKASAGAVETLQMLSVADPQRFIEQSQNNGWTFYAAVAPNSRLRRQHCLPLRALHSPAEKGPCVIMIGGEGEGLRSYLQSKADSLVGIEGGRLGQGGVDSLNVSVAAGLLCDAFCRSSQVYSRDKRKSQQGGVSNGDMEKSNREDRAGRLF